MHRRAVRTETVPPPPLRNYRAVMRRTTAGQTRKTVAGRIISVDAAFALLQKEPLQQGRAINLSSELIYKDSSPPPGVSAATLTINPPSSRLLTLSVAPCRPAMLDAIARPSPLPDPCAPVPR